MCSGPNGANLPCLLLAIHTQSLPQFPVTPPNHYHKLFTVKLNLICCNCPYFIFIFDAFDICMPQRLLKGQTGISPDKKGVERVCSFMSRKTVRQTTDKHYFVKSISLGGAL